MDYFGYKAQQIIYSSSLELKYTIPTKHPTLHGLDEHRRTRRGECWGAAAPLEIFKIAFFGQNKNVIAYSGKTT